mgnify:CR=1 FL=1
MRMLKHWSEGFHFGHKPKIVFETDDYKEKERLKAFYYAHLRFNSYTPFLDKSKPFILNTLELLGSILKYDSSRIPCHIAYIGNERVRNRLKGIHGKKIDPWT